MGKAEPGSVKAVSNKLKSRGLTRLRWYCQVCEKANRDANAFKQHTMSESHVRNLLIVGENQGSFLKQYSDEFLNNFLSQLKTSHGEKMVQANHFYNGILQDKDHVHMNSTRWSSLTEFVKYLGREGICRVEENDKGLHIGWIDNSPEALRRQEALRRKALQDQGDEELEQRMIRDQIRRAQAAKGGGKDNNVEDREGEEEQRVLKRDEGEKIKLSFGAKPEPKPTEPDAPATDATEAPTKEDSNPAGKVGEKPAEKPNALGGFSMKMGAKPQTKNVFAAAKKSKPKASIEQPKKMSAAERIMKEEMERKRPRNFSGTPGAPAAKRQRTDFPQR